MAHSYDLVLQAKTPGEPAPVAALVAALLTRGAKVDSLGRGTWKLPDGEVNLEPLSEEGVVKGLDVRVPMLDKTALVEDVVRALCEIAEACEGRVTDPQRGADAAPASLALITEEYLRMARYAGEYGGEGGALGLSTWAQPPEESNSGKWLLLVVVFAVALWIGWTTITSLRDAAQADEAPAAVDRPPKVPGK